MEFLSVLASHLGLVLAVLAVAVVLNPLTLD